MSDSIFNWWYAFLMILHANRIANAVLEACWLKARGKAAVLSAAERADYLRVQAAPLVQRQVDSLLREDPAIPGSAANQLVVKATDRVVSRLLRRLSKAIPRAVVSAS